MIRIARFVNSLMNSNCYVIHEHLRNECVVIDPACEKCENIVPYLDSNAIQPRYVILTHEHVDHTWGCNFLRDSYGAKLICSKNCSNYLNINSRSYFQFYFDQCDYDYHIDEPDFYVEEGSDFSLCGVGFHFYETPGHSLGSICIGIRDLGMVIGIMGGDALMESRPYISKPTGNKQQFIESVKRMQTLFSQKTMVYPGHGEPFELLNAVADF